MPTSLKLLAGVGLVLTGLLFGAGTVDPMMGRWLAVYALAIAALVALIWRDIKITWSGVILLALVMWSALSLLWSPDPQEGGLQLLNFIAIAAVFFGVQAVNTKWIEELPRVIAACAVVGVVLLAALPVTVFGGFGNENWAAEYLLLCAPFVWIAPRLQKVPKSILLEFAGIPVAIALVVAVFWLTKTNLSVVFVATVAAFLGVHMLKKRQFYNISILLALSALAIQIFGLPMGEIVSSLLARGEIWYNSASLWLASLWIGHGLGGFDYMYPAHQEAYRAIMPDKLSIITPIAQRAGEPHNEILFVLTEMGVIGGLLGFAFCVQLIREYHQGRRMDDVANMALLGLCAGAAFSLVGFPLHNPSTGVLMAVFAGILARRGRVVEIRLTRAPKIGVGALAASMAAFMGIVGVQHMRAEMWFSLTQINLTTDVDPDTAFVANVKAHKIFPYDADYRRQLMLSLAALLDWANSKDRSIDIDDKTADLIYRVALTTSAEYPAIKVSRAKYLMNSGRWKNKDDRQELESIVSDLKRTTGRRAITWVTDGWVGVMTKDAPRIINAVQRGVTEQGSEWHMAQFEAIASHLRREQK